MAEILLKVLVLLIITVCTLVLHAGCGDEVYIQTIYIKPENTSHPCPSPCLVLNEYVQSNYTSLSSSKLIFLSGNHELSTNFSMHNVHVIMETQSRSSEVFIYCFGQSGFLLQEILSLQITDLSFISCGYHSVYGHLPAITINFIQSAVLTNITITESPAGGLSINSSSGVYIVNLICTRNTGNNSGIYIRKSEVFFLGNTTFSNNTAMNMEEVGGIFAISSNLNFVGKGYFLENVGIYGDYGAAALMIYNCNFHLNGEMHFVKNIGHGSVFIARSTFISRGNVLFRDNQANASSQTEGILYVVDSLFYIEGIFEFSKNNGSVSFNNSPFWLNGSIKANANNLLQAYQHGVLTLYDSAVNWTGEVEISSNIALNFNVVAGLLVVNHSMSISGNIICDNNTAVSHAGSYIVSTTIRIIGNVAFRDNYALGHTVTVGFALFLSYSVINGSVNISNNTAIANDYSSVFSTVRSNLQINGRFTFSDNVCPYGVCIHSIHSELAFRGNLSLINNYGGSCHLFYNCTLKVFGTTIVQNNIATKYGGGIVLSSTTMALDEEYFLLNNSSPSGDGGGIYALNSNIVCRGRGVFMNNMARHGGAISLLYGSTLDFRPGLLLHFEGNSALTGGVIYVEDVMNFINCTNDLKLIGFSQPPPCFFDCSDNFSNITLEFEDNTATIGGPILYGGMLDRCAFRTLHNYSPLDIFKAISQFETSNNVRNQSSSAISSEPFRLCFCENRQPNCSSEKPPIHVRRGESFSISVTALDQLNVSIVALVRSYLVSSVNDTEKLLGNDGLLQKLDNRCSDLHYRVWSHNDIEQLVIYADGPCKDVGNASYTLQINFTDCPVGFVFQIDRCVCHPRIVKYTNSCNIDTGAVERQTNFWIGSTYEGNHSFNSHGLILYPNCPFDYCKWPSVSVVPTSPDTQCNYHRTKVLCGSCIMNTSLRLGSSECDYCSNVYLFLLIPFALIGILLVASLFILKLTVATGTLHGLTFYANIVVVNRAIFVPPDTFKGLSVFLSWLNLDFGIKTCFYNGMDQYAKTWLQFLFPTYLLLLVIAIIVMCRYSIRASRLFGSNPVAVLATVIFLSYTKILRNVLATFSYVSLEYPDNKVVNVWLYDGNLIYLQGKHAALFAVALLVLIFLFIPYTILLLSGLLLQKCSCISSFSYFMKLKPFLDAYYAPYKNQHRYWTGLFLFLRCVLLLTFALNALGEPSVNLLAIITACVSVGSVSWIAHGIYTQRHHDVLEVSFIFNLVMFSAATYHAKLTGGNQTAVANTSISVALLKFVGIILFQIYQRIRRYVKSRRFLNQSNAAERSEEEDSQYDSDSDNKSAQDMSNVTFQVIPAPVRNLELYDNTRHELRENLLDS